MGNNKWYSQRYQELFAEIKERIDITMRLTDVATPETRLRLIQSVPSPKAEPLKLWLAKVGYERIQDMSDPDRSLDRAREYFYTVWMKMLKQAEKVEAFPERPEWNWNKRPARMW